MNRRQLLTALSVCCLVLAGCAGPSLPENRDSPTRGEEGRDSTSPTDDGTTGTDGGANTETDLPVNETRTFERVADLLGTDGPPPTVTARKIDPRPSRTVRASGKFGELMGATTTYPAIDRTAGGTRHGRVEVLHTDDASPDEIERTLAHEFVHVLQPSNLDAKLRNRTRQKYRQTTDAKFARTSIVEGVAVAIADEYVRRFLPNTRTQSERLRANWQNWSVGLRSYWSPYYYGRQYVQTRLESGATIDEIYANPPRTAEQILHGDTPDEEPRLTLEVNATTPNATWDPITEDAKGELFVRHVLERQLTAERATKAASGWGNDRVVTYYGGSNVGHVWILRWDDEANTSEFEAAVTEYLNRRCERTKTGWRDDGAVFRLERIRDDTVALVAGDSAFVAATSVSATDSTVQITANATRGRTTTTRKRTSVWRLSY